MIRLSKDPEYGVLTFDDHCISEDLATVQRLDELIEDAKQSSCLEALRKGGHDVHYLTDEKRHTYFELLNFKLSDDVLEIGSSLGQHTRIIARKCKSLSSIEVDLQQAAFQAVWCTEEGLTNVNTVAGGKDGKLPYDDASFDVVIFNYVLEWCAGASKVDQLEFHRAYLKEIGRVIRPGGTLYLSTKNRYSIRYILGSMDEHLGVRFGSALPRFLHPFLRNANAFKGLLHSWRELERIVSEAGFSKIQRILAFPDARYPDVVVPFEEFEPSQLTRKEVSELSMKNRFSLYLGKRLFRKTSNSIVLLAKK